MKIILVALLLMAFGHGNDARYRRLVNIATRLNNFHIFSLRKRIFIHQPLT